MNPLRSKSTLTRLLILLEVASARHTNLKTIAESVGITTQAVSDYFNKMQKDGLMENVEGSYRATKEGMLFLQENLLSIKSFVDDKLGTLDIIQTTTAIAHDEIAKGQEVCLFMSQGLLYASSEKKTPSKGIASAHATKGDVLKVEGLQGMVEMDQGQLTLIELPKEIRKLNRPPARKLEKIVGGSKISALDLESIGMLKKAKIKADHEYSNLALIINNIQRGLDMVCFGTASSLDLIKEGIAEHNIRSLSKIYFSERTF